MLESGYLLAKLKFVHHRVQKSKAEAAPMFAHTRACVRRPQTGTISGTTRVLLLYRYTIRMQIAMRIGTLPVGAYYGGP